MTYQDAKDCFVYIQHDTHNIKDVSLELLSEAKHLFQTESINEKVKAIVLGSLSEQAFDILKKYGADEVIHCSESYLDQYDVLHYRSIIKEMINAYHPKSLLIGGTIQGRELAPRISASVHTGLTADATILEVDHKVGDIHSLAITRPAFGGNLFATIITPNHVPQMATIRPSVFEKRNFDCKAIPITKFTTNLKPSSPIKIEEVIPKATGKKSISDARLIVSAGRGVKDCLDMVTSFAETLHAELGASRALVDEGVVSKPAQVGQTGTTVRPSLYIACGISGALQHTAGMDKSETIIAINPDPNAPIFDVADLGIIGDAKEILPIIIEKIQEREALK